jgi:hypothetical protein
MLYSTSIAQVKKKMQTGANFFRGHLSGLAREPFTDARRLWKKQHEHWRK